MSDSPPKDSQPSNEKRNSTGRRGFLIGGALFGVGAIGYGLISTNGTHGKSGTSALTPSASDGTPRVGGTLVVGEYQEPTVFDPNHQYSWETYRVDRHIYESLIGEDLSRPSTDGPPPLIPALAESWQVSDDATTFTFKLRRGVKFHDGTSFDAHAVEFNVRRFRDKSFEYYDVKANAFMKAVYGDLKSFDVIDDYTVRYIFNKPFRDFPRMLPQGNYVSGIFSPEALKTWGQDGLAEHAAGTGPFRLVTRVHGEKTELARHEQYWGPRPYVDKIVFRPIIDDSTRLAALQAGEIDILTRTPADAVHPLSSNGYTVPESTGAGLLYLGWNFKNKFAQDVKVRQAIIQSIDREGLAKTLFKGHAIASYSILNPGNTAYDPAQKDFAFNPDAARRLLSEAGFKDGDISFTIATDEANQPSIEWIQRDLAKVGINVKILSQEWLTYTANLPHLSEDIALASMEWGFVTPLWLRIVYQGYVVARGGKELLGPELAASIDVASVETDEAKAIALWKSANGLLQKQAGIVPLLSFTRYFSTSAKVKGFNVPAQNWYDLSRVWISA